MPRLLDQVRSTIRVRHLSDRTEEAYIAWIKRYVRFCGMRHPRECGEQELRAFLVHLARERHVGSSTQNQARAGILFLYRDVLRVSVESGSVLPCAKRGVRTPNVLEPAEVAQVFAQLAGVNRLVVMLLYGAGLRLGEALSLRVKDVDLTRRILTVRSGKGAKDRRPFTYSEQGGGIHASSPSEPPGSTPFVHVENAQAAFDQAIREGAEVVSPPERVMEGVTIAMVRAPGGVVIGLSGP